MKDSIEDYCAEQSLHGTALYQRTAEKFGVNRVTLANLEQGKNQLQSTFNASKQKLTPVEEDVLVKSIILASCQGIPYAHGHIREEANAILQSHLSNWSEKVGKHWVNNFLCRHNHWLHTYWSTPLPSVRAKAGN